MKILLDAMGGDNAPKSTVQGAADAVKEFGDGMTLALLGDEAKIKAAAQELGVDLTPFELIHCTEDVDMHDDPVKAVRHKTDSSLVKGLTMLKNGETIEDCVETIASTLPICAVRGGAYSTFTIIRIIENEEAEIIQYDNPFVVLLRNGKNWEYPREAVEIGGKTIYKTRIPIQKDDTFIAFSDGAIHAGIGMSLNFGWERKDIIDYMEMMYDESFTAKTLNALLLDECNKLYGGQPGDDTTAVCVKVRERCCVNLMIGPPSKPEDLAKMHEAFFSAPGKRIVCGGTTSTLAAEYLKKPIIAQLDYLDSDIPPTAKVEGLDLVTEGVITMSKVVEYAKDYLEENRKYSQWGYKRDGASMIARMLFEEATDINFFVGRAVNPAHQNPNLPINFNIKMQLVENLCTSLEKMGKKVKVSYF